MAARATNTEVLNWMYFQFISHVSGLPVYTSNAVFWLQRCMTLVLVTKITKAMI